MVPEFKGKPASLDELRRMGNTGLAWALVEGSGTIYGAYVITEMQETKTFFEVDGTARKIEFSLTLRRIDQDDEGDGGYSDEMGDLETSDAVSMS
jgi:phage protein U